MTKMKAKKSVKKARMKSAEQIAARRIGCPGVGIFRLDQLKPAGYNPRVIDAESLAGLTNSISRFGCVEPIVVNMRGRKNVIIGGNQRFKALRSLGVTECLCVTVNCSKADEKLLNLTLNNPQIQGDFVKKIVEYIEKLRRELPDDNDFLNLRIAELQMELGPGKTGRIPDDDIPRIPEKVTARTGDLWILGKHRLLCGDSTKEADVSRLMNGQKASLFATDPPYGVGYTGKDRPQNSGKDWSDRYSDVKIDDVKKFIKSFYVAGLKHVKKNTALYLWHASECRRIIDGICDELDILRHQQIIWAKPCIVFGFSLYAWRHEPCVLMWQRGHKPYHIKKSISIGTVWPVGYDRSGDPTTPEYYTDVWELDYDGKKRRTGEHPTIKPVEIFAIPMRVHTKTGDICYEPFCGSGSQIIAAEKLDRRCFAMEKEPVFVGVAIERWEQWTGKKAKLKGTRQDAK
ncbi:MAG: site-specific DNA-methyltransferase [Phycisphaerae bacterium]